MPITSMCLFPRLLPQILHSSVKIDETKKKQRPVNCVFINIKKETPTCIFKKPALLFGIKIPLNFDERRQLS